MTTEPELEQAIKTLFDEIHEWAQANGLPMDTGDQFQAIVKQRPDYLERIEQLYHAAEKLGKSSYFHPSRVPHEN